MNNQFIFVHPADSKEEMAVNINHIVSFTPKTISGIKGTEMHVMSAGFTSQANSTNETYLPCVFFFIVEGYEEVKHQVEEVISQRRSPVK
jgi:hypothetical protein